MSKSRFSYSYAAQSLAKKRSCREPAPKVRTLEAGSSSTDIDLTSVTNLAGCSVIAASTKPHGACCSSEAAVWGDSCQNHCAHTHECVTSPTRLSSWFELYLPATAGRIVERVTPLLKYLERSGGKVGPCCVVLC